MRKDKTKHQQEVRRLEQAFQLAQEEGYDNISVYKKKKKFVAYEATDMYHHKTPAYIVVEFDDNTPYLALKSVVDEM